mgnify:CR=1 FL=1
MTGLTLGLSFAGLNYASAEEHHTPVNEATVEAIIKEGAIDVEAPATNEATAKPVENTPSTASSETATVSEAPVAASEVASSETVSENQALKSQAHLFQPLKHKIQNLNHLSQQV